MHFTPGSVHMWGFPGGSDGDEAACRAGDLGSGPRLGRPPWRREWPPTPVFWPGESHGRSQGGYSPWGGKGSDMIEQHTHACTHTNTRTHTSMHMHTRTHTRVYMSVLLSQFVPPSPSPAVSKVCSLCLCLYSCPENRFISIVFLDSVYTR